MYQTKLLFIRFITVFSFSVIFNINIFALLNTKYLSVELPNSIYMTLSDDINLDLDKDGLKDSYENILADTWRPYFIFDEKENAYQQCHDVVKFVETVAYNSCVATGCASVAGVGCVLKSVRERIKKGCRYFGNITNRVCKPNIHDKSLQPFEPVVIFQVRPIGNPDKSPKKIKIQYIFLYRLDGGFRTSNICTNYHYGDTQSGSYILSSKDNIHWKLQIINLWSGNNSDMPATSNNIQWTAPRSTYYGQIDQYPSPIIYASAGKHHQYINTYTCENEKGCDDDCGGGVKRLANLTPKGSFTNVGEYKNPLLNNLTHLGYTNEYVWFANYYCNCGDGKKECFTGGLGKNWHASGGLQKCDTPTPIYKILDTTPIQKPKLQLGTAILAILGTL